MMTRFLTLAFVFAATFVPAQGKVNFSNDSARAIVFNPIYMLAGDEAYGGLAVPASPLPSGGTLYTALYAGTTAALLSLQTAFPLTSSHLSSDGRLSPHNLILSGIAGGSAAYFQIYVWNSWGMDFPPGSVVGGADLRSSGTINPFYYGTSGLFTFTPGTSVAYPPLYSGSSTWASGDIIIYGAPEPSSLTLLALNAGLAFYFRRRC